MRLQGLVAVITGAAGGIGRITAQRFAEEGAAVVCVDVDEAATRALVRAIKDAGGRASAVITDVGTEQGNEEACRVAETRYGGLDVFDANAAIQLMGSLSETTTDQWDALHRVNLRGVYLGARAAIPRLQARGGGSLVITASLLGLVGDPNMPAYGAMKGGLRALARSLAAAHGVDGIRVNTICPGDVETPMLAAFFDHQPDPERARKDVTRHYPLQRLASPLDVANAALFLASNESAFITGTDLVVDGGLLARIY